MLTCYRSFVLTGILGAACCQGGAPARFALPNGVAIDSSDNLYVADSGNGTLLKVVLSTGVMTTLAGSAYKWGSNDGTGADARFHQPAGVAVDGAGNLYVADSDDHTIRKVVLSTGVVTTLAGSAGKQGADDGTGMFARFNRPAGVTVDGAGNLYVADSGDHTIRKVVLSTGVVTTLVGSAGKQGAADGTGVFALFNAPTGVAVDRAGNLYVTDSGNSTIRKVVLATGAVTTLAGANQGSNDGIGAAAQFFYPGGVTIDSTGNLYVSDTENHTIRKVVLPTGDVTTLAGTAGKHGSDDGAGAAAQFYRPAGVTVHSMGNLYVSDMSNDTIRKVVLATGEVTTL